MNVNSSGGLDGAPGAHNSLGDLGHLGRVIALAAISACLVLWASPPTALLAGILFTLVVGHPFSRFNHRVTRWLLQICVVLLGFGMNLPEVLRLGLHGSLFAAVTIGATLILGRWIGQKMKLGPNTSILVSAGTAICGGSAIAAVSTVIGASEAEIAVSIGTIFLLNAVALYVFPVLGHLLHLSQPEFGLWAGVAIHDISSVVGAGLSYGTESLQTATAVKLSRTLWIVPLSVAIAFRLRRIGKGAQSDSMQDGKARISPPWFIAFFLLASFLSSYVPAVANWSAVFSGLARRGMVLVLFLIGTSLSIRSLRAVGWRTAAGGLILWTFISVGSLAAIRLFSLEP